MRARKVFGQSEFIIVSQKYHNERAIYIAHRNGLSECVAYNARKCHGHHACGKQYACETLARVVAVIDVEFLKAEPKMLGERVFIGEKSPPVDANPLPLR